MPWFEVRHCNAFAPHCRTRTDLETHGRHFNQQSQPSSRTHNQRGESCLPDQLGRTGEHLHRESHVHSTESHNQGSVGTTRSVTSRNQRGICTITYADDVVTHGPRNRRRSHVHRPPSLCSSTNPISTVDQGSSSWSVHSIFSQSTPL